VGVLLRHAQARGLAVASAIAVVSLAHAEVQRRRLAVVTDDPLLVHAVGLALDPWDVDVVPVPPLRPLDEGMDAGDWARGIAAASQVELVVWLSTANPVSLGWYESATHTVHTRDLAVALPLDESEAAAVALTLKAELRSDLLAPGGDLAPLAAAPRAKAPVPLPRPVDRDSSWEAVGGVGARWMGGPNIEPRMSLGARAWPGIDGGRWGAGAGIDLSLGTGLPIDEPAFRGRWMDAQLAPTLRFRWRLWRRAVFETALGASVHLTWIAGTALVDGTSRSAQRVDGSIDGSVTATVAVAPRIAIGLAGGVAAWLRYQAYVVHGDTVLALTPAPLEGEAFLRLRLD
jgi:hypothetical protein